MAQTLQNLQHLVSSNVSVEKGCTYWLTGLSGAGKSTLAEAMKAHLDKACGSTKKVFILDGDIIRQGLNKGLGFSVEDRAENIRRIGEVSKLMNMAGQIVFVAFIAPEAGPRDKARETHEAAGLKFQEVYISASLEVCEKRDTKGLYKKARAGIIPNFTGVSAPYDAPKNGLNIDTGANTLVQCMQQLQSHMLANGIIKDNNGPRPVVSSLIREHDGLQASAKTYPQLAIDQMQAEFVQTIGEGWANPLKRFMNEMELLECMNKKTLTVDGKVHLMSVPITQHCTDAQKKILSGAEHVTLTYEGKAIAIINKPEFYENRKEEIATRTFGCFETSHPYVERIMAQGEWLISGESMDFIEKIMWNDGIDQYRMTPGQISAKAKEMNADAVFAFQVRNPLHNGHCLLLKQTRLDLIAAGYKNPILLLHPLGGWCKDDDVPLAPRMEQHQALIDDGTIDKNHIILAVWPSPMFYGGPTEVLWHASSRVGCGITHFITGRDPAGVGHPTKKGTPLYDGWHGQKLLKHNQAFLGGVEVLPFKVAALNTETETMEFFRPAEAKKFKFVSGSEMRSLGASGAEPPKGFMSPAGWKVLKAYYQGKKADAVVEEKKAPVAAPKVEAPKVEAPKVEAPKVEAPKTEAPKVEAPKAETPKVEEKKEEKAEESSNWAYYGVAVAAVAVGAFAYFKNKN